MTTTSLASALAGGSRFIKWEVQQPGDTIGGTIAQVEMRQAKKYQKDELDFWDDGKPKMQAVLTLSTPLRDPQDPEDDGTRSVGINLWSGQKRALVEACETAGVREPQVGQQFTVTWVSGKGMAGDPRVFKYTLSGAGGLGAALVDTAAGEVQQPTPAAAPAAPAAPPIDAAAAAAALANLSPEQRAALGL